MKATLIDPRQPGRTYEAEITKEGRVISMVEVKSPEMEALEKLKPCNNCDQNIKEAALFGEVSCFTRCDEFRKWQVKYLAQQQRDCYGD